MMRMRCLLQVLCDPDIPVVVCISRYHVNPDSAVVDHLNIMLIQTQEGLSLDVKSADCVLSVVYFAFIHVIYTLTTMCRACTMYTMYTMFNNVYKCIQPYRADRVCVIRDVGMCVVFTLHCSIFPIMSPPRNVPSRAGRPHSPPVVPH